MDVLPALHDEKPAAGRLFGYLSTLVPSEVKLASLELLLGEDLSGELSGTAATAKAINVFVDTLKNAELTYQGAEAPVRPFTSVVLEDPVVEEHEIAYRIIIKFDALLFDNTLSQVKLTVPNITTSNSVRGRPVIFEGENNED